MGVKIKYVICFLLVGLTSLSMGNDIVTKAELTVKENTGGNKIPEINYVRLDGKKYTNTDIPQNKKIMIVYFNPLCDLCQEETTEILNNINYFQNVEILMISPNSLEQVKQFHNLYKLAQFPQITVLHDAKDDFYRQFDAIGYPSLYLFDEKLEMITKFEAQVGFEDIKNAFEQNASATK